VSVKYVIQYITIGEKCLFLGFVRVRVNFDTVGEVDEQQRGYDGRIG